jgi:hypothetical protein
MAVAASGSVATPFVAVFAWLAGWLAALPLAIEAASGNASSHFEFSLGITPAQVARSHAGSGVMVSLMTATIAALTTTICGRGDSTLVATAAAARPRRGRAAALGVVGGAAAPRLLSRRP